MFSNASAAIFTKFLCVTLSRLFLFVFAFLDDVWLEAWLKTIFELLRKVSFALQTLCLDLFSIEKLLWLAKITDLFRTNLAVHFAENVACTFVLAIPEAIHIIPLEDQTCADSAHHVEALCTATEVALDACTSFGLTADVAA